MEINLATFCLNLFESMEMGAKEKNLAIRCLPGDDTFDRSITLEDYVSSALEVVLWGLITHYSIVDGEILLYAKGSSICIKNVSIQNKDLWKLCIRKDGVYEVAGNKMGLALAYLDMVGVRVQSDAQDGAIMLNFEHTEEDV
ncbi:hypothetical protein D3Z60_25575 [Lachnospiraceae bacterium]|nr:hypothetical protein [Lachnospiraceae bacterium]